MRLGNEQHRCSATVQMVHHEVKKMVFCLDNVPYHHSLVADGFRPDGMNKKDDIVDRLGTLRHKRGVRRL